MEKVAIIGPPGAGKTKLAKNLGSILKIKVIHLDRWFWQTDWEGKTSDVRIDILLALMMKHRRWIIEGTYLKSSKPRLDAADTIIFLDINAFRCLWRVFKRHFEYRGRPRRDIPKGCTDKLDIRRILKVLAFPFRGRKKLKQELEGYEPERIVWLRSPKEVEGFLMRLEQGVVNNKKDFSYKSASNQEEKPLANIR